MGLLLVLVPTTISVVFVIVGWLVIYKNAQKIATRAETKGILDSALFSLKELTDLSIQYWITRSKTVSNSEFEVRVSHISTKFALSLELINKRGIAYDLNKIQNLMDLCTLDCEKIEDFNTNTLREKCNEIASESTSIYEDLMTNFHNVYKPVGISIKKP